MKTIFFFFLSLLPFSVVTKAQTDSLAKKQTIHGVVRTEKNKPIQNASVLVEGDTTATTTDSLGYFKIDARPDAVLIINADGYDQLMRPISKDELVHAVMMKSIQKDENSSTNEIQKQQALSNAFQDFGKAETGTLYHGSSLPVIHQNDETKGSRYLFKDWVRGTVINDQGATISDSYSWFNYDKISKSLLVTKDKKIMIQVDPNNILSFNLKDQTSEYDFQRLAVLSPKDFFMRLVNGNKYSLYKSIKTHFVKADYHSDGLVEFGKNYDEYVDESTYYVVVPDGKQSLFVEPVELKKKSIKQVLEHDQAKVNSWFTQHKDDTINESFLVGLINSLNQ